MHPMDVATAAPTSVLLVEDDPDFALLVGEGLRDAWRGELEVNEVTRLGDALDHLAEHGTDCMVLDLSLPDAVGLDAVARVVEAAPTLPVVVLTGREGEEGLGARAVRLGAQDYLVKGRGGDDLLARTIRYAIERKRGELERSALEARYAQQSFVAETLQADLVPVLPAVSGYSLGARYEPSGWLGQVGGDWYDVLALEDGRVAAVVGDVVGHGVEAAAMMGQVATATRAYALEDPDPAQVLNKLNRLVVHFAPERMTTLVYALLDPEAGTVGIASAGHPPALMIRAGGSPELIPDGRSTPLGFRDMTVEPAHLDFNSGDHLVLYTDGLIERRDEDLQDGLGRLTAAGQAASHERPEDLTDSLVDGLSPESDREDDVAVLAVRAD